MHPFIFNQLHANCMLPMDMFYQQFTVLLGIYIVNSGFAYDMRFHISIACNAFISENTLVSGYLV